MTSKWLLRSRTFLGALLVAVPGVLQLFGIQWTGEDTALAEQIIDGAFVLIGLVMTAYGRIKAAADPTPVTVLPTV